VAKRGVSHDDIAKRLGLARSTVTKILNQLPSNRASSETVKKVFDTARDMGYDFHRLRNIHRRRSERKQVDMEVGIEILSEGKSVAARGTATLRDVSLNGAAVADLTLDDGAGLPVSPFLVRVRFTSQPLSGVSGLAEVVRFTSRDEVRLGLNFVEIESDSRTRLAEFLG
jgi:hypothetical protein